MSFRFTRCYTRESYAGPDFDSADANDGDASALSMI